VQYERYGTDDAGEANKTERDNGSFVHELHALFSQHVRDLLGGQVPLSRTCCDTIHKLDRLHRHQT
jgi:hypothetical protein